MSHNDPLIRLRQSIAEAETKRQLEQAELGRRAAFPQRGDLFTPPVRSRVVQGWALLHAHPQQPSQWYCVPVDDHILAGVTDIVVPAEAHFGPLIVRCGSGLWLSPADVPPDHRFGFLETRYLTSARNLLARFVRGQLAGSAARRETEEDPEYDDWLARIDGDRTRLERWVERQATTLPLAAAERSPPGALAVWLASLDVPLLEPLALAAAPGGQDAALLRALTGDRGGWLTVTLPESGQLCLLCLTQGVRVFWFGASGQPPRIRVGMADGRMRQRRWQLVPNTPVQTLADPVPWVDNEVALDVGPQPCRRVRVRR